MKVTALLVTALLVVAVALAAPIYARSTISEALPTGSVVVAAADDAKSEGEIRKVDASTNKITIKHGELKNLDMPAMTMVFQVKDPAMIDRVKPGDKVMFRAEKINGAFTVIEIEVVH